MSREAWQRKGRRRRRRRKPSRELTKTRSNDHLATTTAPSLLLTFFFFSIHRHNRFTPAAHADLLRILFTSLWGGHPSLFLPGPVPSTFAEWENFNLTQAQAQAISSGVSIDVRGKGKEREWLVKPVVGPPAAPPASTASVSSARRGWKCEKGFEKGEVIYRCK